MKIIRLRSFILLVLGVMIAVFGIGAAVLLLSPKNVSENNHVERVSLLDVGCVSNVEEKIVRGNSLAGVIEDGKTVRALFGYYLCNEPRRGDVVLYHYAGDENPLIKIVRAVPGDTFHLVKEGNVWQLVVNGKALTNAQGIKYQLGERAYRMLSLYERDYHGVIPPNTYLLLGNLAEGSLDSTHFGLVDESDMLGKVEY